MKKKLLVVSLCAIIAIMAIAGSSLAWLKDETGTVVNTFTEGKVDIDLYETKGSEHVMANSYKMIPGNTLTKDPTVEVLAVSEACWLFVKIEKTENFDTFLTYGIADGWTLLEEGVYYREVDDTDALQKFAVLANNQVTVKTDVNMGDMNTLSSANYPQLKFTAYAVQKANVANATTAWNIVKP
jgi:hypothetical protein